MSLKHSAILEDLLLAIPAVANAHSPATQMYSLLKRVARSEVEQLFSGSDKSPVDFRPFGELIFPYRTMGNRDSLNLFDLDELIIFGFYYKNRARYHRVLDLGANLGLHSILLARSGYEVTCYEPDPVHFEILRENLRLNDVGMVKAINAAISNESGHKQFVRVLGNTTGSHLAGSKANPYGELEYLNVKTVDFRSLLEGTDLIKMDIEGHERDVILQTTGRDWEKTDAIVEIENSTNGKAVFDHLTALNINIFAQKMNWNRVERPGDMPTSYREGSVFISGKAKMLW